MEIIFLYGAPATGKLTIAKELEKITGYKIFHNHLVNDVVSVFFPFLSPGYYKYTQKIRQDLLNAAEKEKIPGVIMTFCYAYKEDDRYIKNIIKNAKKNNSKIRFVHMVCNEKELKKRISHVSRKKYGKLRCKKKLGEALNKWEFYESIPFVESLRIDNTTLPAKKVAQKIKRYYKIKKVT